MIATLVRSKDVMPTALATPHSPSTASPTIPRRMMALIHFILAPMGGVSKFRRWSVTAVSKTPITVCIVYQHARTVYGKVTYPLGANKWSINIEATSPETKTRILKFSPTRTHLHPNGTNLTPKLQFLALMLTQHTHRNLDALANPDTGRI